MAGRGRASEVTKGSQPQAEQEPAGQEDAAPVIPGQYGSAKAKELPPIDDPFKGKSMQEIFDEVFK